MNWSDEWRKLVLGSSLKKREDPFTSREFIEWYELQLEHNKYPGVLLEKVRRQLGRNSTVLDIGSGTEAFTIPLAKGSKMQKSRIKEGKTGIYRRTELEKAVEFHGHLCPPIVFGMRASQLGLERLRVERPENEEIVAVIENNSCMVDAIQSASGCTLGKGNLILKNYEKMAVVFINRANGEAIRLIVKKKVMEDLMNSDFGRARREGHLPHEEMMKMAKEVSQQMMELSDEELFDTKKVQTETPRFARIFRLAKCSVCDEYFGETFGRVKDKEIVCIPCFEEAK